jgi:hypothetical protein
MSDQEKKLTADEKGFSQALMDEEMNNVAGGMTVIGDCSMGYNLIGLVSELHADSGPNVKCFSRSGQSGNYVFTTLCPNCTITENTSMGKMNCNHFQRHFMFRNN